MSSVVTMIEFHILPNIWKVRRIDLVPLVITFFGCFYDIEVGILSGIAVALCILLYQVFWPPVSKISGEDYVRLKINGNLNYPGVEHVTNEIQGVALANPRPTGIIIDFSVVTSIDFTVTQALLTVLEEMGNKGIPTFFSDVQDNVCNMMVSSGIDSGIINPNAKVIADSIDSLKTVTPS